MRALLHTLVARVRGWLGPADLERDFDDEIATHLAMAEADKMRRGMTREEARRRARAELGGVTQLREAGRAARGLPWVGSAWLDLKLGVRLLVKYPGLTVVSTLALSIGIAIVAGFHAGTSFFVRPTLPVPDEDRIVAIWNHDTGRAARGALTLGDTIAWRDGLRSVESLGAFALTERVISTAGGPTELVRAAQISPGTFGILRVAPLLGRTLIEADARTDAPPVALIGFDLWRSTFARDPAVVGRRIRVGGAEHQIVGVMPDGFAFPVNEQLWTPMPIAAGNVRPGGGPAVEFAVGRLAAGATLAAAGAELQVLGARVAAEHPYTHARVRPRVETYARSFLAAREPELAVMMQAARWAIGLVLLIVAVNVGTLVYARNAARVGEVAVRTALGASRRRIALQMFAESLVLASLAGAIGLAIMAWPVHLLRDMMNGAGARGGTLPYWFQVWIGTDTILLIAALVLLTAVVTGFLPALKLTTRQARPRLSIAQEQTSGLRFGRTATVVVVAQVGISTALLTVGAAQLRTLITEWRSLGEDSFRREEYLAAELRWDLSPSASETAVPATDDLSRRADTWRALGRRLEREPDVLGATFSRFNRTMLFALGVPTTADRPVRGWAYVTSIEPDFFDVFGKPIQAGRVFAASDAVSGRSVAIVNEEFVRVMSPSGTALGRYVRPVDPRTGEPAGEALEVVGVVPDILQFDISHRGPGWRPFPTLYVPLSPAPSVLMSVHTRGEPSAIVARLGAIAAELDPTLVVHRPESMAVRAEEGAVFLVLYAYGVGVFIFAVLLLATAGTYSMMSFTVAQRTREIGIRTALGAGPRRVVGDVFARATWQLGTGAGLGLSTGLLASNVFATTPAFAGGPGLQLGIGALLVVMGLMACGRPVFRALRIQPTEALRD